MNTLEAALDEARAKMPKRFTLRINMDRDGFGVFVEQHFTDLRRYVGSGDLSDLISLLDSAVKVAISWKEQMGPK